MNNKLKPALIGGVVLGLLSAIPFVNIPNVCCCLWAVLGGLLGSYLYIKGSRNPVRTGEGAVLGALAGVVGAVIYLVLGIPLAIATRGSINAIMVKIMESANTGQAEEIRRQLEGGESIVSAIFFGFVWAILLVVFSTLGGLLGVAIFEKRKGQFVPPPPPQNFGGPGNYGSAR